jgi:hypothetical protein
VLRAESGKGALDLLHRLLQRNDAVALMVGSCSKSVIGVEVSFMQRLAGEWLA